MILLFPHLSSFKRKKILIITHAGADVDAIAAAGALFFVLRKKNRVKVLVPEHISKPAKAFAARARVSYRLNGWRNFNAFDCLFLVDFNSLKMAGNAAPAIKCFKGRIYLIDHHTRTRERISGQVAAFVNPDAVASCELVFELLKRSRIKMEKRVAICIAAGIITDIFCSLEYFRSCAFIHSKPTSLNISWTDEHNGSASKLRSFNSIVSAVCFIALCADLRR